MTIRNEAENLPRLQMLSHLFIGRDGNTEIVRETTLCEHHITVFINGEEAFYSVCLGEYIPELVLGHLLTEGFIRSTAEVESVSVSAGGETAQVVLSKDSGQLPVKELSPVVPMDWKTEWIFELADQFAAGMPLHSVTFATHSAFLGRNGECLFSCEDIGRHNALDKVIGFALLHGIVPSECYIYSSGRLPIDMVAKVIRAGIPVFAGKASPTAESVSLAQQHGLTLLAAARRDRMKLYSGELSEERA